MVIRTVAPLLYPLRPDSDIGGEVYERMLVERLPGHGIEQRLALPRDHALAPQSHIHIDLLGYASGLHWARAPRVFVPYLTRLLRKDPPHLLRGHSVRGCGPSLLIARTLTQSTTPVVLHHHHFFPRWQRLEAAILRRADAVITVSEHSKDQLLEAGVQPARIHVVANGVSAPPDHGPPTPELWPDPAGIRLLYVGRLETRKRPGLALETLAELQSTAGRPASLVLAGDGPERDELQRQAQRLGVAASTRFLGRTSEPAKWQLYDTADLLLFGSTLEGFGLVVAEAQSRGLPVIAARGTATAEIVQDGQTGLLADPTATAFAHAARTVADDPQRAAAMRARAAQNAARFDWDRAAAQVAHILRGLIER